MGATFECMKRNKLWDKVYMDLCLSCPRNAHNAHRLPALQWGLCSWISGTQHANLPVDVMHRKERDQIYNFRCKQLKDATPYYFSLYFSVHTIHFPCLQNGTMSNVEQVKYNVAYENYQKRLTAQVHKQNSLILRVCCLFPPCHQLKINRADAGGAGAAAAADGWWWWCLRCLDTDTHTHAQPNEIMFEFN